LTQPIGTLAAPLKALVLVRPRIGQRLAHRTNVHKAARVVKEDRLSLDLQERGVAVSVTDRCPQPAQRHAQVAPRFRIGVFRPQQPGQGIATEGSAGVQRQVGQQCAGRVRAKLGHRLAVQRGQE
jgi:hypothetical protein